MDRQSEPREEPLVPAAEILEDDGCDDDELRRRIEEIDSGTAETYSMEEIVAELRARFG